ncbi:phospholipase D family protein [Polaromonas glacialis]|uniref:phospholipase D family protein n=1 Tax=Polaromonas glacialis TaxID=866564 RepID=UPI00068F9373|nr:phospholipase D family protein [Polaromonas glacialis]
MVFFSVWLTGCTSLPSKVDRPVSTALANPMETRLGQLVQARAAQAGTRNDSGFALVGNAELAFTSRMTLIKAAQKTLDIQYYAIFADDTTERMFVALREAAGRGVRIRILLDDFNTSGKNAQVLKLAFEKNIELRLFNPLPGGRGSMVLRIVSNLKDVARMQRRMHNKIFVADNAVAITGGRNLGETYFGQSEGTNFIDIDVLAAGRIARDLSRSFDQYWNNPLAYPVQSLMTKKEIEALKPKPAPASAPQPAADAAAMETPAKTLALAADAPNALPDSTDLRLLTWAWAPSALLVDQPSKIAADADDVEEAQETAVDGLLQLMSQAKTDLLIVSPYFVPGERMMSQFAEIRRRGVRVRVLTNSLASNDAPAAHVGYARYREALLAMGIEIYEMRAEQEGTVLSFGSGTGSTGGSKNSSRASLHAKVVVMDGSLLVVGSMNLDLRSKLQNSEVAIIIRNRALSLEATRMIEPALTSGAYHVELVDGQLVWRAPQGSNLKDSTTEPDASLPLKLLLKLIGPLAPDEML